MAGGGKWWQVVEGGVSRGGGRPLETTGDRKGQFPRTVFHPLRKFIPLVTPPGPRKLRCLLVTSQHINNT